MSDMNNELRDMFDSAEFQPSARVWENVESALTAKKKKKGILFYWQTYGVAAALVAIAMFTYLSQPNRIEPLKIDGDQTINQKDKIETEGNEEVIKDIEPEVNQATLAGIENEAQPLRSTPMAALIENDANDQRGSTFQSTYSVNTNQELLTDQPQFPLMPIGEYRRSLAMEILEFNARINFDKTFIPEQKRFEEENKSQLRNTVLTAGLGNNSLGNGGLAESNAVTELSSPNGSAQMTVELNEEERMDFSWNFSAGVSNQLSKRLSLISGLRFSLFRTSLTSNAYSIENGKSLPVYIRAPYDEGSLFFAGSYELKNTYQSLMLENVLGYSILDQEKFGVMVLGGFGIERFFNYRVTGSLSFLDVRKVNLSNSTGLSPWSLNGLTGIEANYKIDDRISLGANFIYRQLLSSDDSNIDGINNVTSFGFNVRYALKKKN